MNGFNFKSYSKNCTWNQWFVISINPIRKPQRLQHNSRYSGGKQLNVAAFHRWIIVPVWKEPFQNLEWVPDWEYNWEIVEPSLTRRNVNSSWAVPANSLGRWQRGLPTIGYPHGWCAQLCRVLSGCRSYYSIFEVSQYVNLDYSMTIKIYLCVDISRSTSNNSIHYSSPST